MGAWSIENFGNDHACDWGHDLVEKDDVQFIESTLQKVLVVGPNYLNSPVAEEALAAAEIVARMLGNWGVRNAYTKDIDSWIESRQIKPSPALINNSLLAIDRILDEKSELRELWEEAGEYEEWIAMLIELKARLKRKQ